MTYNHTMKSCFLAYMTSAVINNTLPLLFLTFQKSFGITVAQLGFLVALNFGVQMVVDFIGAKLSTAFFVVIGIESWRYLIFAWALLPFFTMLLFTRVPMCSLEGAKSDRVSLLAFYKQKGFIIFFVIMICSGAAEQAMAQWVSYFAEEGLKVSKTFGDIVGASMFALCMAVGRMFYAKNSERLNLRRYLIACALVVTLAFVGASLIKAPVFALVCCGICGLAVAIMWPGTLSLATQTLPGKSTAMFAMLAVGGDIGCTIGPETVAIGASLFTVHDSAIKAGMICAAIFPVLLALGVKATSKKRISQQ